MARPDDRPYLLTVLQGPNAGAQVRLGRGGVTLGPDDHSDIALDDPGLPSVRLDFSGHRLRIDTVPEGVTLDDGRTLAAGRAGQIDLPATFDIGEGSRINVCRVATAAPQRPRRRGGGWVPVVTLGLALTAVGLTGAASVLLPAAESVEADPAAAAPAAPDVTRHAATPARQEIVPTDPAPGPSDTEAAAAALRDLVTEAGLIGLSVAAEGGAIRVTGRRSPEQAGAWSEVRRTFDQANRAGVPLLIDIREEAVGAPLAVASAWFGGEPEITTRDGALLGIGDETSDGWVIEGIAPGEVTLARDGQTLVIEF